ncbi:MAG: hypothetical protein K0S01_89 [Herbinix sp.]|jgi:uncharacterized membrane protein|nr:hypothetical protein [Herbinix sp.]
MSRRVKPNKGKLLVGIFVGLILCCIGIFVVLPISIPLGIILILLAVVTVVVSVVMLFTRKSVATSKVTLNNDYSQRNISTKKTAGENLNELQSLYKKGMITVDEFKEKRKQLF